jgi:hypothetical protein
MTDTNKTPAGKMSLEEAVQSWKDYWDTSDNSGYWHPYAKAIVAALARRMTAIAGAGEAEKYFRQWQKDAVGSQLHRQSIEHVLATIARQREALADRDQRIKDLAQMVLVDGKQIDTLALERAEAEKRIAALESDKEAFVTQIEGMRATWEKTDLGKLQVEIDRLRADLSAVKPGLTQEEAEAALREWWDDEEPAAKYLLPAIVYAILSAGRVAPSPATYEEREAVERFEKTGFAKDPMHRLAADYTGEFITDGGDGAIIARLARRALGMPSETPPQALIDAQATIRRWCDAMGTTHPHHAVERIEGLKHEVDTFAAQLTAAELRLARANVLIVAMKDLEDAEAAYAARREGKP